MSKPLFIWAGGKNKMIKYHNKYLPSSVDVYSEPFFGGGAMFLYIVKNFAPKHCYINDINSSIINIYQSIKNDTARFCKIMDEYQAAYMPLTKEQRKEMFFKLRYQHAYEYQNWDKTYEAAVLYFLMKTGFNGIWQINKNTNGRYGTPAGLLNQKTSVYDKEIVLFWSKVLANTTILNGDYKLCPTGDLNYFDPPYRNSFTAYGTTWGDKEITELVNHANNINGHVLLCNRDDDTDFFDKIRDGLKIEKFPITYTAGRRKKTTDGFKAKKATEILLYK